MLFIKTLNRVSEFGFKDLKVILKDPNVPTESKDALTKYFIDTRLNDFKIALNTLSSLNNPLRKIINIIKNSQLSHPDRNELIQNLIDVFEKILSILRLYPDIFKDEIILVEALIKSLLAKPEYIERINFPLIDFIRKLDSDWSKKDPDDFQFLKNLREKLTRLL